MKTWQAWLLALAPALLLQLLAVFAVTPGIHETEELWNASHAAILAEVGPSAWFPLQYQPFCGGCAVDAGAGALSFKVLGPSIAAWRLVGLGWFALALVSACSLASRFGGTRALVATGLLFAAAPPAYQELALILNGNHPEAGALLVAQLALGAGGRDRWWRLALQGLLVGFGLYVVRSLALGVVGLGLCLVYARSAVGAAGAVVGVVLGALPLLAVKETFGGWPVEPIYAEDEWKLSAQWVGRNFLSLFSPGQLRGIWGDGSVGWLSWLGIPAFVAWVAAAWSGRRTWILSGTLAGFTALYLAYRLSVWMDGESPPLPQQVRYLGLVFPAALTLAGVGIARAPWRLGLAALVLLGLPGLARRASTPFGPWSAHQKRAPADGFFAERARGPQALLDDSSRGHRHDLRAVVLGRLESQPGYFVPAMEDGGASLSAEGLDPTSLDYGRTLGLVKAFAGDPLAAAIAGARVEDHTLDAWLLPYPGVVDGLSETVPPKDARAVWSLGRGRAIGRSCIQEEPPSAPVRAVVVLGETCPIELGPEDLDVYVGIGIGTSLGTKAATLEEVLVPEDLDPAAVERGLQWAREALWLPDRLPEVTVRRAPPM